MKQTAQQRAKDAQLLKESGVHKLVITDRDGNCLAYVLAWDSFEYDAETDTYVCRADTDGREVMTIYTQGEVKPDGATDRYSVTAPLGRNGREIDACAVDVAASANASRLGQSAPAGEVTTTEGRSQRSC
jgi:hypothetical protein